MPLARWMGVAVAIGWVVDPGVGIEFKVWRNFGAGGL